jgi:GTP1/Obg family GTP-binding protein
LEAPETIDASLAACARAYEEIKRSAQETKRRLSSLQRRAKSCGELTQDHCEEIRQAVRDCDQKFAQAHQQLARTANSFFA